MGPLFEGLLYLGMMGMVISDPNFTARILIGDILL